MNDTPLSIEMRLARMYAQRSPGERLRMASSMFSAAKKLVEAGIRSKNSSAKQSQLRARLFLSLYRDSFPDAEIRRIMNAVAGMQSDGIA